MHTLHGTSFSFKMIHSAEKNKWLKWTFVIIVQQISKKVCCFWLTRYRSFFQYMHLIMLVWRVWREWALSLPVIIWTPRQFTANILHNALQGTFMLTAWVHYGILSPSNPQSERLFNNINCWSSTMSLNSLADWKLRCWLHLDINFFPFYWSLQNCFHLWWK